LKQEKGRGRPRKFHARCTLVSNRLYQLWWRKGRAAMFDPPEKGGEGGPEISGA
jgi:hypothetical protein